MNTYKYFEMENITQEQFQEMIKKQKSFADLTKNLKTKENVKNVLEPVAKPYISHAPILLTL